VYGVLIIIVSAAWQRRSGDLPFTAKSLLMHLVNL
jgi:hypothetical protein